MKYQAVCFDLDDTLYDYKSANELAEKALFDVLYKNHFKDGSFEDFQRHYSNAKKEIKRELSGTASSHNRSLYLQRFFENTHNSVRPTEILTLFNLYWDTLIDNMVELPGATDVLQSIKSKGIPVLIVTNLTTNIQLKKIIKLGIEDHIDYLVTSEETGVEKPHPAPFLMALNKVQVLPRDAMFVGDSVESDIEGSNAVGMTSIHINPEMATDLDLERDYTPHQRPNHTIKSLTEILSLIE